MTQVWKTLTSWQALLLYAVAVPVAAFYGLSAHHDEPDPISEFALEPIIGPHLQVGMFDFSITKAVIYLWLGAAICVAWALWMSRRMSVKPDNKQTFTELFYEFAHDQIAKATLGPKVYVRYMPYVASLFFFLWVVNMISFFPLPLGHHWQLGLYAATSNLNVTLALTLVTFLASHFEGLRHNGPIKYFGSWAPPGSLPLRMFIWPLHAMSEMLRLVSLSVRLFANMLAGHLLIAMMLSLLFFMLATAEGHAGKDAAILAVPVFLVATILLSIVTKAKWALLFFVIGGALLFVFVGLGAIQAFTVPISLAFYLFEFGLVASLQAYIFAMLSGIYIGGAAEPHH